MARVKAEGTESNRRPMDKGVGGTETAPRSRPVWEAVGPRLEALLAGSGQWRGGKQRLTATRLHGLLIAAGSPVGVTLVKDAVAEWKMCQKI